MMDDLVEWLPAQLDDDEQVAGHYGEMVGHRTGFEERWLREVEAKRAILAQHTTNGKALCSRCVERWDYYHDGCEACADEPHEKPVMFVGRPCPTVLALAAIYRDRPGYQEEWRP